MTTVKITDDTWQAEVIDADGLVLVDVWAEWCGPCKQIEPILEELSNEYAGQVKIVKLNADENPTTVSKLGVRGIPAMFMYENGNVLSNKAGAAPKATLDAWIQDHL